MFRVFLCLLLIAWSAGQAAGQIDVPAEIAPYQPIVATLTTDLPEGAQMRGSWQVTGGALVEVAPDRVHIWAAPGTHTVTARGIWVLTKQVTLPDGQTIQALLDFGQYDHSADFTVAGGPPDPPPPPPPGERWAVIWMESSNQTPQQANLYAGLRADPPAEPLLILDQSQLPADWKAYREQLPAAQPLPALAVYVDRQLLRAVGLPSSVSDVKQEIAR